MLPIIFKRYALMYWRWKWECNVYNLTSKRECKYAKYKQLLNLKERRKKGGGFLISHLVGVHENPVAWVGKNHGPVLQMRIRGIRNRTAQDPVASGWFSQDQNSGLLLPNPVLSSHTLLFNYSQGLPDNYW